GTAGRMRRIPRLGGRALVKPRAVGMAYHRDALSALGPVPAGTVFACRKRRSIWLRAGENVVRIRRVAAAVDDIAFLGKRGLLAEIVVAVQLRHILGDDYPLGVRPWPASDAIARV